MTGHPRAKDPAAVVAAVRERFDGPIASRIRLTKEARDHEHRENARAGEPQPSDSAIEGTALRQLLDVIEFLAESIRPKR